MLTATSTENPFRNISKTRSFLKNTSTHFFREEKLVSVLTSMGVTKSICCRDNEKMTHIKVGIGVWTFVELEFFSFKRVQYSFDVFNPFLFNILYIYIYIYIYTYICVCVYLFIYLFIYISPSIDPLQGQRPTGCGSSQGTLSGYKE